MFYPYLLWYSSLSLTLVISYLSCSTYFIPFSHFKFRSPLFWGPLIVLGQTSEASLWKACRSVVRWSSHLYPPRRPEALWSLEPKSVAEKTSVKQQSRWEDHGRSMYSPKSMQSYIYIYTYYYIYNYIYVNSSSPCSVCQPVPIPKASSYHQMVKVMSKARRSQRSVRLRSVGPVVFGGWNNGGNGAMEQHQATSIQLCF